ncbi:MAG: cytochrome c biogenesis protein ResB [Coriobacteriales bacterium]|nr:cytochrome c biogenesis protein ResB [Coriobacteriales bacterium]
MTRPSVVRALTSAKLVVGLLLWLAGVAFLATLVPQGAPSSPEVLSWAAANPALAGVVRFLGLNSGYTSWIFLVPLAVLAVSTALCSWQRTRTAVRRFRAVRDATPSGLGKRARSWEVVRVDGASAADVADVAERALAKARLRVLREGNLVSGTARGWGAFGSPVFHWSLLALILLVAASQLTQASGLMGVPVGDAKPIAPQSYGTLRVGPLHAWSTSPRSVAVPDFDLTWVVGELDRGPTPLVRIVAPGGHVLGEGRVYPNSPLRVGSITVHSNDYGLAARIVVRGKDGRLLGSTTPLLDFDASSPSGTTQVPLEITGAGGAVAYETTVTVKAARSGGELHRLPKDPRLSVTLRPTGAEDASVTVTELALGESLELADGSTLRFDRLTYYARLSVVDDWSVPWLYALLAIGLLGLGVSILAGPRVALVESAQAGEGAEARVWISPWRGEIAFRDGLARSIADATAGTVVQEEES